MSDSGGPARPRIRWAWIVGCVVLGLAAIGIGWVVAPEGDRLPYFAAVLGGVGTTLLLVGFVVLLERRIVDSAVRQVWRAADEARVRLDEEMAERVNSFTERANADFASATAENVDEKKERVAREAKELADEIVARELEAYDVKEPEE